MPQIVLEPSRAYPTVTDVGNSLESHTAALRQIVEALDVHERRTSDVLESFVRVGELQDLNLIQVDGETVIRDIAIDEATHHHHDSKYTAIGGGGGGLNNIVEDLTPQLGGALDVNGQTIDFGDNEELRFGTGNDVVFDFNATDMVIHAILGTTDLNITGFAAINAGTVDADFDAITATSYGGITEANLLDKSAAETVSGVYTFSGSPIISSGSLFITEGAADEASVAARGQLWVINHAPNHLCFTNDADISRIVGMAQYELVANQNSDMSTNGVAQSLINGAWYSDNATAYTLTLEPSTDTQFPVAGQMTVWNEGSGTLTINEGTGTTLYYMDGSGSVTDTAGGMTLAQGGFLTIIRKSTTVYLAMGAGGTA